MVRVIIHTLDSNVNSHISEIIINAVSGATESYECTNN